MPLGGPASAIRWVEIDPCYVFHGMNAWREGDDVVLDVCRMAKVFETGSALGPPPRLHRWRINTERRAADVPRRDPLRPRRRPPVDRPALHRPREPARLARRDPARDRRRRVRGRVHVDAQTGTETRWDPGRAVLVRRVALRADRSGRSRGRRDDLRLRPRPRIRRHSSCSTRAMSRAGPMARDRASASRPVRLPRHLGAGDRGLSRVRRGRFVQSKSGIGGSCLSTSASKRTRSCSRVARLGRDEELLGADRVDDDPRDLVGRRALRRW